MNYKHLLHEPMQGLKNIGKALLDMFAQGIDNILREKYDYTKDFAITTASTTGLDRWGIDLNLPRKTNESDTDYRYRLLQKYQAVGITKESLEDLANLYLFPYDTFAQIYEWWDEGEYVNLEQGEFRLEIEPKLQYGLAVGVSGMGYYGTNPTIYDATLVNVGDYMYDTIGVPELIDLIEHHRMSGSRCIYGSGGYTYEI